MLYVGETHQSYRFKSLLEGIEGLLGRLASPYEQISTRKKRPHLHTPAVLRMQRGLFWHKSACYTVALKWTLIGPSRYARVKHMAAGSFPHWYNALPTVMKLPPDHIQQSVHGEAWLLAAGWRGGAGLCAVKEGHYSPLIRHPLQNFRHKAAGTSENLPVNFRNLLVDGNKPKVWCKNREKLEPETQRSGRNINMGLRWKISRQLHVIPQ